MIPTYPACTQSLILDAILQDLLCGDEQGSSSYLASLLLV